MTFLLKLATLPLIALLTLMEWLGIFALSISQFITNKLAALIFFIACCCLLFGKVTFREAAAMFAGSFCVFALPYAAERILERISDLNRCVKDWARGLIPSFSSLSAYGYMLSLKSDKIIREFCS